MSYVLDHRLVDVLAPNVRLPPHPVLILFIDITLEMRVTVIVCGHDVLLSLYRKGVLHISI